MKLHKIDEISVVFHCPACKTGHRVQIGGVAEPIWWWNRSLESPTFSPSIKVIQPMWNDDKRETDTYICHSMVANGVIHFQDDCSHELKGQIVELPDWDKV